MENKSQCACMCVLKFLHVATYILWFPDLLAKPRSTSKHERDTEQQKMILFRWNSLEMT